MTAAHIAAWTYVHLAQIGVVVLGANTIFQKLPIQQQNDLVDAAWKGAKWLGRGIVAKLTPHQQEDILAQVRAIVAEAVRAEIAKPAASPPEQQQGVQP
jgi:hypothetical protein